MAKAETTTATSKQPARKRTARSRGGAGADGGNGKTGGRKVDATGKHLVIVESPAKAKTINRYLGPDFVVQASVGHVRDLPSRAPKGSKQPVPGVDLENRFKPHYEVMPDKKKVVGDLKKAAKLAADVWFATDLDREGEAIAWHLAQELEIEPDRAKRVVFDAITKGEIQKAFDNPRAINEDLVNAQQARRILDRIVGYQVSPLLWKKVARGLSAGRVQSVAVRLIVDREREIRAFVPDEIWKVGAELTPDVAASPRLRDEWNKFLAARDEKDKAPTIKSQNAWLAERKAVRAELVEVAGEKFELVGKADDNRDLTKDVEKVAQAVGLINVRTRTEDDPKGKGPAATLRFIEGEVDPAARYSVKSIETKRTTTRPPAPFITSTLQMAAASFLGFGAHRTMRTAQGLYEGVNVKGEGQVGLITYMRTDSTHLSGEALNEVRGYVKKTFGDKYLPEKPNFYGSSNESAQEAHEAIRPTDVSRHPDKLEGALSADQARLYRLIWNRFVSCQMVPAQWDSTAVMLERSDKPTGAVMRTTGRVLVFEGFYRATGIPTSSDEQMLPEFKEKQALAPFGIDVEQTFTSPPPRYSEASLIKKLEEEGIGRPSTYASIINVIQDREYVEQVDRRFFATPMGEVVTDKLIEAFPQLLDVGYTRLMEKELDQIAYHDMDWIDMLEEFYAPFAEALEHAHENMKHAKAETQPAPYACPKCGHKTVYRFGKNGMFLSCSTYPTCEYAAPIDREGHPMLPERVNVACPEDGSPMVLRTGRFGKFLASVNYPETKCVVNLDKKEQIKYPAVPPLRVEELKCEKCGSPMNLRRGKRGPWLGCSTFPKCKGRMPFAKLEEKVQAKLVKALEAHEAENPQVVIRSLDGKVIPEGTPIADLTVPGGVQELPIHPDSVHDKAA
ncbi:MAG TPA: type I DNA topoisomerase [Phycisphaerales bacterium]|nr:type I DNA topoisomerase [Phycisphaerales bacterium]